MTHKKHKCPAVRVVMFPKDTNCHGNIFGGVLLSHIDVAAGVAAAKICSHRLVTVSMKEVIFKKPVHVGDVLTCWTDITRVGTTSISIHVWVEVERKGAFIPVTEADVVYVAVDNEDKPLPIATGLIKGWKKHVCCTVAQNAGGAKETKATKTDSPAKDSTAPKRPATRKRAATPSTKDVVKK